MLLFKFWKIELFSVSIGKRLFLIDLEIEIYVMRLLRLLYVLFKKRFETLHSFLTEIE